MWNKKTGKKAASYLLPAFIVGAVILVFFRAKGYFIFGSNSLAYHDANIQYMDFFHYFKNVLEGRDSLIYTFQKGLGGTGIALYSYYLASPFNFLLFFVPAGNMPDFIDLLFLVKMSLAGTCMAYFLEKRFEGKLEGPCQTLIAVGYALSNYSVMQARNPIWLDSVYMLPLVMLGMYYLIRRKSMVFLSLTIGLTVLFNWYMGGILCLFTIFWFFCEYANLAGERACGEGLAARIRDLFASGLRCGVSMALGLALSAVLFLPTVIAMRSGRGAGFDWQSFRPGLLGNPLSLVQNHTVGAMGDLGSPALLCGSLVTIAVLSLFSSSLFSLREKVRAAGMLVLSLAILYFQPLHLAFSLFKKAGSFHYRYGHLSIFVFCFLAGLYFSRFSGGQKEGRRLFRSALGMGLVLILLHYLHPVWPSVSVGITFVCLLLIGLSCRLADGGRKAFRVPAMILLSLAAIFELTANMAIIFGQFHTDAETNQYFAYTSEMDRMAADLSGLEGRPFRLSQTSYRGQSATDHTTVTAMINDGLAHGLMTNACYTSCTENVQLELMENLGYRLWADTLNVVNTSILPADALLGVRYTASSYPIRGLVPVGGNEDYAGKKLYENPYAFPMAYTADEAADPKVMAGDDPFLYTNEIYAILADEENARVFDKVGYEEKREGNSVTFFLPVEDGDCLYGNLPMERDHASQITVNGRPWVSCGKWLSGSVFYIPAEKGERLAEVTLTSDQEPDLEAVQFYRVDRQSLAAIQGRILKEDGVRDLEIGSGRLRCQVTTDHETYLQTSVIDDRGWQVRINGRPADHEALAGSLIRIPLKAGQNQVEMTYRVPGLAAGALVSLLAWGLLTGIGAGEACRKRKGK